jgi:hypothetical protein
MTVATVLWATGGRSTWSLLLPLMMAGLVLLQLIPLPDRMLVNVAPVSAGAWKVAHEGMRPTLSCISIDPASTAAGARRLLLGIATTMAVIDLAKHATNRRWLMSAIGISGLLIWGLGLAFPVEPKSRMLLGFIDLKGPIEFWKTPLVPPVQTAGWGYLDPVVAGAQRYRADGSLAGDGFGPFIYSNHFAGAMCLMLPAILASVLSLTKGRLPQIVRHGIVLALMIGALWTVGFVAKSRAGTAALVLTCLVFAAFVAEKPWPRRITGLGALGFAVVLLGLIGVVYGPFHGVVRLLPAAIQAPMTAMLGDARIVAAHVALRMFRASPLLGTGLDTYAHVFPRFQPGDTTLYYAHNDYAQLLAETGLVGAAVATAVGIYLILRGRRFYLEPPTGSRALGAGAWAALAGIAVHSAFDWNMHLPANAFLASLIAGLAASSAQAPAAVAKPRRPTSWIARSLPAMLLVAACLGSIVLLARDALSEATQRQLRESLVAARLATNDPTLPSAEPKLSAAAEAGQRMAAWDAGDATLAVLMGQIYLHLAAEPQPIDDASARVTTADNWFTKARRNCAACRGLPAGN